jgi:hypothetical protein
MFGILKKIRKPKISNIIKNALSQKESNLHIDIYIDNQILFQVVPAKYYDNKGLTKIELNGFIELHFFNKNKTLTLDYQEKLIQLSNNGEFTYYEEPKGIHNYIKPIGMNPEIIEIIIKNRIKNTYHNIDTSRISIRY